MNHGVNYMREHIKEDARLHYAITEGGGQPNVVPPEAEVWYYVRANKHSDVEKYFEWVQEIAQAAALMSRTKLTSVRVDSDMHEVLPNRALSKIIHDNLKLVGAPHFSEEEKDFARKTQKPLGRQFTKSLSEEIEPLPDIPGQSRGSTDTGDQPSPAGAGEAGQTRGGSRSTKPYPSAGPRLP